MKKYNKLKWSVCIGGLAIMIGIFSVSGFLSGATTLQEVLSSFSIGDIDDDDKPTVSMSDRVTAVIIPGNADDEIDQNEKTQTDEEVEGKTIKVTITDKIKNTETP